MESKINHFLLRDSILSGIKPEGLFPVKKYNAAVSQKQGWKNPGFFLRLFDSVKNPGFIGFFLKKPTDFGFFKIMIFAMYFKRKI